MYMICLTNNVIVTVVYWTILGGYAGDYLSVSQHMVPMLATGVEFLFNRIVFEHNLSWVVALHVFLYGFAILWPYTATQGPAYSFLSFDSVVSWLMGFGLVACAPIIFFVIYGL